jgi:hypothetical protein
LARIHKPANPGDFYPRKSTAGLKPDGIQPEFSDAVLPLDMNMGRLIAVAGV